MSKPVVCTIVAKNYLAQARCLTDSFLENHPDGEVYVLVIDDFESFFKPSQEHFTTVAVDEIGIDNLQEMIYRYTVLEFSTALKPFFLEHLFQQCGCEKVCYVDPDIFFYNPIDEIWKLLDSYGVVLTPHLLDFLDDGSKPSELDILRSGTYNLGFIGLSKHPELYRLLHWWQRRVAKYCIAAVDKGLFVDQKWMDLAPGLFSGVRVHHDPGCNVAYWNLKNRHVQRRDREYIVNGVPLKFFHFSGFSPDRPNVLSKHQNRFTFRDLPNVRSLFEAYRECLLAHGYGTVARWPYTYNYHRLSGVRIPDAARALWEEWASSFGLAYRDDLGGFLGWLNEPVDEGLSRPILTRLTLAIYQRRPDLRRAFPDVMGRDRSRYVQWFLSRAESELGLDDFFVEPVREGQLTRVGGPLSSGWARNIRTRGYIGFTNWLFRIGIGRWLERTLGNSLIDRVRGFFVGSDSPPVSSSLTSLRGPDIPEAPVGLNVVGYLRDETGVGEVARASMKALQQQGFPVAYTMVSSHAARKGDLSVLHMPKGHPYAFNWFHANADQVENVYEELGSAFFAGKYNIGYWAWELDPFPDEWMDCFQYFDEIWVGSSFVQRILAPVSPIPIIVIGAPIEERPAVGVTRRELGLPEDRFLFLFVFDMLSYIERKNPFGVIEAYRRAFGSEPPRTKLVIKVTNLDRFPRHRERLEAAIQSVSGILIDRYLDRDVLDGLFHASDAYVSLHRSEGFGLTIGEAMRLGKPTIATAYSSTQDYLNVTNGYPVGYRLIELAETYGPYQKGGVWADPDLDQAAEQMRRVFENPDEASQRGERAATYMQRVYGGEAVASRIIDRLRVISSWRR